LSFVHPRDIGARTEYPAKVKIPPTTLPKTSFQKLRKIEWTGESTAQACSRSYLAVHRAPSRKFFHIRPNSSNSGRRHNPHYHRIQSYPAGSIHHLHNKTRLLFYNKMSTEGTQRHGKMCQRHNTQPLRFQSSTDWHYSKSLIEVNLQCDWGGVPGSELTVEQVALPSQSDSVLSSGSRSVKRNPRSFVRPTQLWFTARVLNADQIMWGVVSRLDISRPRIPVMIIAG
jgi:hypothetical protein